MNTNTLQENPKTHKLIATLNHYGYMLSKPDPYSRAFVDYAALSAGPVLDIGTAYGGTAILALKKGAFVIANDLDERHLEILKGNTPQHLHDKLILKPGKFPNDINLPAQSLSAVLASGALHYLHPEELLKAFQKIFDLLKPEGKFFFFTATPHIRMFQSYFPLYKQRKERGEKWPGFIEDSWKYAPQRKDDIPKMINLLDEDTLTSLFDATGFIIEQKEYVPMEGYDFDMQGNGREYIGIIARRP